MGSGRGATPDVTTWRCVTCHASYERGERFCPLDGGAIVDATESDIDPLIGRTIDGRYLVRRLLGRGGMGAVYAADHLGLDKPVAIKFVVHDDADRTVRARFRQEARAASKVVHEHVVQIFDVGADDNLDYIVMEYVEGTDLQSLLADGSFEPARAIGIIRQVLIGLSAIHQAGVIHRDIKPANILVTSRRPDFIKIMDFGIAKRVGDQLAQTNTGTGRVIGTPQYMAPEQLAGHEIDHRADLYAAGVTLFAMVTGTLPFAGTSASQLGAMLDTPAPSPETLRPNLPPELVAAIVRALETYPDDRFASASDFVEALPGSFAMGTAPEAPPALPPSDRVLAAAPSTVASRATVNGHAETEHPPPLGASRRSWIYAGAALAVMSAVATIAIVKLRSSPASIAAHDAAVAVAPDAAPDLIALAHTAEANGELAKAVGYYEEVYATTHAADLLFRIADLYERLGATERAAVHFERYLAAAPDAPDRVAVTTRLAKLRAPVERVGSGSGSSRPRVTPANQAQPCASGQARLCVRGVGTEAKTLCSGATKQARCSCIGGGPTTLCPIPLTDVSGVSSCSSPITKDCLVRLDAIHCNRFYFTGGTHGALCVGFGNDAIELAGEVECLRCTDARFVGRAGDACSGFDGETGEPLSGVLGACVRFD